MSNPVVKRLSLFFLVNAAIIATMSVFLHSFSGYFFMIPVFGSLGAFVSLLLSNWLAKRVHDIHIITLGQFKNKEEKYLYELVADLSQRAGLAKVPEVDIYNSNDMNAFATGMNKNSALVAFSMALLDNADEKAVAGVAAHEVAHIANGDMVTLTLVQAVVNTFILLITLPLSTLKIISFFSDSVDAVTYWVITIAKFIATLLLTFLGSLVVKAFSRHREFQADLGAAQLLDSGTMIHALEALRNDQNVPSRQQEAFAAFKISSPGKWLDIFSTHPSLERRIERLKRI